MTPDPALQSQIAARLGRLRERIGAAGGSEVSIVGVTKAFGPGAIVAAMAAGLADIGESYAQEALAKLQACSALAAAREPTAGHAAAARTAGVAACDPPPVARTPRVHFVGRLQRNKVKSLAAVVDVWQSVDRPELGAEIAKRSPGATVMMQVDISGEPSKGGVAPRRAPELLAVLQAQGLDVVGVMGIAAMAPGEARKGFRKLRQICDDLELAECSMGMSADLEIAVAEGSTMVRVGTALFGSRPAIGRPAPGPAAPADKAGA